MFGYQICELSKRLKLQTLKLINLIRKLITKLITKSKLASKNCRVDILDLEECLLNTSKRAANLGENIKFCGLYL